MSEEKKDSKKCGEKKKIMFAYGFIQLGSSFVSAIALAAIAFGFCSVKKESKPVSYTHLTLPTKQDV